MMQFILQVLLQRRIIKVWALALMLPSVAFSQGETELGPVSGSYAITNITIVPSPGRKIEKGTVVIKDGLITGVGTNISVPSDAIIIKGDSMYLYAGFIDGYSHTGVATPKTEKEEKVKYPGNPPPARAGITPENDVRDFLSPESGSIKDLRNQGFTVAQVVPHGNLLPGQAAIIQLTGNTADEMVIGAHSALYSELTGASRVYPATIMGVMAKWRELYRQAVLDKNYENMYAANPAGLEKPNSDRVHHAFYPVIDRQLPVLFKSEKLIETQRVFTLKNDLGFNLQIADLKEGWPIIDKVKSSGAKVFLSLDIPEAMKEAKKDEKTSEEKEALEKRKKEAIANYTGQAAAFAKAGIPFGFSANSVKAKDIQPNLRRMIAAGLSEDAALASLTTTPAQLLGLTGRMGTVENGKMANLVISDKPYFSEKAKVKYVFVYGTMYTIEAAKKSSGNKAAKVSGSWSYTADTPQGKGTGKLVLKEADGKYSGTITNNFSGEEVPVKDFNLDGTAMTFNYTIDAGGTQLKIEVAVEVDGDTFEGTMTAGEYGSFPMQGSKEPK